MVTNVIYLDQVEEYLAAKYDPTAAAAAAVSQTNTMNMTENNNSSGCSNQAFELKDFVLEVQDRRDFFEKRENKTTSKPKPKRSALSLFPAKTYLRKMRKANRLIAGQRVVEVRAGPRIAVINAVGGINTGKSSKGGPTGQSLGSDSLISLVRRARRDSNVKAVVLRIDSPGGSALASDLMWREIRLLSKAKPVVASMVDVAASGGYYIGMACDKIVAEEFTVTGSIGTYIRSMIFYVYFIQSHYNLTLIDLSLYHFYLQVL
jgi:ClpP class serine protease